jgi:hypothetical protein
MPEVQPPQSAASQSSGPTQVSLYPTGEQAEQLRGGYFLVTHGTHLMSRLIRFGQSLRFRGDRRGYAHWNHVALVLDEQGSLGEALSKGVVRTDITKYRGTDYYVVQVECSEEDRRQVLRFAQAVLDAPSRTRYGWSTIASLALSQLTGSRFVFGAIGTAICSGFVSEALVRTGEIFPRPPAYMTPADLAEHYKVGATV